MRVPGEMNNRVAGLRLPLHRGKAKTTRSGTNVANFRSSVRAMFWTASLSVALLALSSTPFIVAQSVDERVMSEHIRIRVPLEREWLGRDTIMDIERCYRFMNAATGNSLPRTVRIVIDWSGSETVSSFEESSISIGMSQPAALVDQRSFLIHSSALELARLGLHGLCGGATDSARAESEFLVSGMAQILMHEYERSSRSLNAAWIVSRMLDEMKLLGFSVQTSWPSFSGGQNDLRSASPGITFLMTCRELRGRDRLIKFFEALRKGTFQESLVAAFKSSPAELEAEWLKRVRNLQVAADVTVTSDDDAPLLLKTVPVPESVKPGSSIQLQLFFKDRLNNLSARDVFLQDEASGLVLEGQAAPQKGAEYIVVTIPVEAGRSPGQYGYRITAVDDAGNVRNWTGKYNVLPY